MHKQLSAALGLVLLAVHVSGGVSMADDETFTIDAVGPQIGDTAPEFTLPDQWGRDHSLASLMGPKGLVLVFFRSADW